MAIIWSGLHYVYPGPQTMLFLQLGMLWLGVGFLYFADEKNKFRWLYLVLPFFPSIFVQLANVWKDVAFVTSFFLAISICIYCLYQTQRADYVGFSLVLIVVFYGMSVKHQAQFIVAAIIFFMSLAILKLGFFRSLISSAILSFLLISTNVAIIGKFSVESHGWQLREVFDMAAIAQELNDDSVFPQYIKDYPGYDFARLKKDFTHQCLDSLIYPADKKSLFSFTQDKNSLNELNTAFINSVTEHPLIYLKHRLSAFSYIMLSSTSYESFASTDKKIFADLNIHHFPNNILRNAIVKALKIVPQFLTYNIVNLIIAFSFLFFATKKLSVNTQEKTILLFIAGTVILYSIVYVFATQCSDYRYYYFARLVTIMTIPVFIKVFSERNKV